MTSFEEYYEARIASLLPGLEKKRVELATLGKRRLKIVNILATVLTAIGAIYAGFYFQSFLVFFSVALSMLIAMVLFQEQLTAILLRKDGLQQFKKQYKEQVIRQIVSFLIPAGITNPTTS